MTTIYKKSFYKSGLLEIEISLEHGIDKFGGQYAVVWRDGYGNLMFPADHFRAWWGALIYYRVSKEKAAEIVKNLPR